MTNREAISIIRKSINESTADTSYTNKFIFSKIMENGRWLITRDAKNGRLYKGTSIFQNARCIPLVKSSTIPDCCNVATCCELYRTRYKINDMWEDVDGPIVKAIMSIDSSHKFTYISSTDWQRKINNPYLKNNTEMYVFYEDGYFWFPTTTVKKVNILGFFRKDISNIYSCKKTKECIRFLDEKCMIPEYLMTELNSKLIEQLMNSTKRIPIDTDVNKNSNRIN